MIPIRLSLLTSFIFASAFLFLIPARAQGNYEVQVYGADQVEPRHTMVELHSNFTFQGSKKTTDGTLPTIHNQLHETIEITHGFTDWFETGFYVFTSSKNGQGTQWVGDHIRPRVRIPKKWNWPVGLSLSNEFGYQRARFSADTWTWELRPIIDKQIGRWYGAFNPSFDRSFHGPAVNQGVTFSPNLKVSYDFTKKLPLASNTMAPSVRPWVFLPSASSNRKFCPHSISTCRPNGNLILVLALALLVPPTISSPK